MYFYNTTSKSKAVINKSLVILASLAQSEKEDIIIRDNTGTGIKLVKNK